MVLILFVEVLKKVLKSLKFELKNPAETLFIPEIICTVLSVGVLSVSSLLRDVFFTPLEHGV